MGMNIATVDIEKYRLEVEIRGECVLQYVHGVQGSTAARQVWKRRRSLGKGGFGEVSQWRWKDKHGDSHYRAVKICAIDKMQAKRVDYKRELSALAAFSESEFTGLFVNLRGWWMDSKNLSVAMEYLSRGDLSCYVGSKLHEVDAKEIIRNVLQGLKVMHREGFTHRDIKPQNILVVENKPEFPRWWVKIADFGLSKRTLESSETVLHSFLGTPDYCAPEVLDQSFKPDYTNKVDMWSLGCVLFNISSQGQMPFTTRSIWEYCGGRLPFNSQRANLRLNKDGMKFIEALFRARPEYRPTAPEGLEYPWFTDIGGTVSSSAAVPHPTLSSTRLRNYNSFLDSIVSRVQPRQAGMITSELRPISPSSYEGAMTPSLDRDALTTSAWNGPDEGSPDKNPETRNPIPGQTIPEATQNITEVANNLTVRSRTKSSAVAVRQSNPQIITPVVGSAVSLQSTQGESQQMTLNIVRWLGTHDREPLPLNLAASHGQSDVVRWLVEHGAIVNEKDKAGRTPLHSATIYGYTDIVQLLAERGASIDEKDGYGHTPLHTAAIHGHVEVVRWLVEHGADPDQRSSDDRTPLSTATYAKHTEVVQWLVEHGASIDMRDSAGQTALHSFARFGDTDMVRWLAEHGASIRTKDDIGQTPLHDAAVFGHIETVEWLAEHGALIDEKNYKGQTALQLAKEYSREQVVKYLLAQGAIDGSSTMVRAFNKLRGYR